MFLRGATRELIVESALSRRTAGLGRPATSGLPLTLTSARIREQFGGAITARKKCEQCWRFVEKRRGRGPLWKVRVIHHVFQKRNIGFHASDAELTQGAVHALAGLWELAAPSRDSYQQRIVEWRDDCAAVSGAAVEPDPKPAGER